MVKKGEKAELSTYGELNLVRVADKDLRTQARAPESTPTETTNAINISPDAVSVLAKVAYGL